MPSNHPSRMPGLTRNGTGPDDGVASPLPSGSVPMLIWLNLNSVVRSAARGVGRA